MEKYLLGIGSGILIFIIVYSFVDNEPRAIDVYRNKTTLQITYKDSIAIDSVVVWK